MFLSVSAHCCVHWNQCVILSYFLYVHILVINTFYVADISEDYKYVLRHLHSYQIAIDSIDNNNNDVITVVVIIINTTMLIPLLLIITKKSTTKVLRIIPILATSPTMTTIIIIIIMKIKIIH